MISNQDSSSSNHCKNISYYLTPPEQALNSTGVPNEIYVYQGVGHAFANPSGNNYAPEETSDAWQKTLEFLKRNL
jgi:dienelactone hydrolase